MTAGDNRYLVAALLAVDGVADAVVEPDDDAQGPGVLRLRLVDGADEVAVSDEVNRMLRANFRLAVDAEHMHVAGDLGRGTPRPPTALRAAPDLTPDVNVAPPTDRGAAAAARQPEPRGHHQSQPDVQRAPRLSIHRVQMVSRDLGVTATVSLGLAGEVFSGEAHGAASSTSIQRCVAAATLRAVEHAVNGRARFEVDYVEAAAAGREQAALTMVTMVTGRGSERLSGASVVREDVRHAVIRSVLSAVNRRVDRLWESGDGHI